MDVWRGANVPLREWARVTLTQEEMGVWSKGTWDTSCREESLGSLFPAFAFLMTPTLGSNSQRSTSSKVLLLIASSKPVAFALQRPSNQGQPQDPWIRQDCIIAVLNVHAGLLCERGVESRRCQSSWIRHAHDTIPPGFAMHMTQFLMDSPCKARCTSCTAR